MKANLKASYLLQTALVSTLAFIVFESLRRMPFSNVWKELGKSGMGISFFVAVEFALLNLLIHGLNFVFLKKGNTKVAFDLPSILWLILGTVYLLLIYQSGTKLLLEYLPIILFLEPILYNQGLKRWLN